MTNKSKTTTAKANKSQLESKLSDYPSKSAMIRDLSSKGLTRSEIAKIMEIRYQHVRNVLITPIKRKATTK